LTATPAVATTRSGVFDLLGVPVSMLSIDDTVAALAHWRRIGAREFICITSVHGIVEAQHSVMFMETLHKAGLVLPDGKPLAAVGRLRGHRVRQIRGSDFMRSVLSHPQCAGWRHFFFGTTPITLGRMRDRVETSFPAAVHVGDFAPPFRPVSNDDLEYQAAAINEARPDVVWVGLSTPKQEEWMMRARPLIHAPIIVGAGAAFDFLSGGRREAPRVVRAVGLEWAFRLAHEPRRLLPRYARNNPAFVRAVLAESMRRGRRHGRSDGSAASG
jgi:N-acetylglucosaminyldiphosphoundecaprenol N-acetyl-beta-D-mannosaminyltransferase